MEKRPLIQLGRSLVVTIPKSFIDTCNLKKGDSVVMFRNTDMSPIRDKLPQLSIASSDQFENLTKGAISDKEETKR